LGEKEQEEKSLAVTKRLTGTKQSMSVKELIDEVRQNTNQMPYRPLTLPQKLSKRPKFV
jgi:threonyl-tRNA synthetase